MVGDRVKTCYASRPKACPADRGSNPGSLSQLLWHLALFRIVLKPMFFELASPQENLDGQAFSGAMELQVPGTRHFT